MFARGRHRQDVGKRIAVLFRVATVREKVWKMKFFPGQGKVREFGFESGKIAKSAKVREKSGNFKIFSKGMVFGNVSMGMFKNNEAKT